MKKLLILFVIFIQIAIVFGQQVEHFKLTGNAKLIAQLSGKNQKIASGILFSKDQIKIKNTSDYISVQLIHGQAGKEIVTIGGDEDLENTVIKVYEYDFDLDGKKEILVIYSSEYTITKVQVFKHSSGIVERVGNFSGQTDVHLSKNTIYLPFGSQGLGAEFIFMSGSFFELVYHDPNEKDK